MRKKSFSIILGLCLLVFSFAIIPGQEVAASGEGYDYIYIRPDNIPGLFEYNQNSFTHSYGWTRESDKLGFNGINIRRQSVFKSGETAYTLPDVIQKFYIKEAGTYRIMARVWNQTSGASGRYFRLYADGVANIYNFGSVFTDSAWRWDPGYTVNLAAGEHTITITGTTRNSYARTDGILITNDAEMVASTSVVPDNTYTATIQSWEDYSAPTWEGTQNLTATDINENSITIQWSAANDNKGVMAYEVFKDNVSIATLPATQLTYTVENLVAGKLHNFKVAAKDSLLNSAESETLDVSTLDGRFDVLSHEFTYESGLPADRLRASDILKCKVSVQGVTSGLQSGVVIIALYDDEGKLNSVSYTNKDNIANTSSSDIEGSLQIPSAVSTEYKVKVMMWDNLQKMRAQNVVIPFN